jgi:hypothetical protein
MRFMMFVLTDPAPDATPDEADVDLWVDELAAAGRRLDGDILDPRAATVVRVRDGDTLVTDGAVGGVTDTLWGFDILDAANLDEAIALAARHPMARNGRLELRPFPEGS